MCETDYMIKVISKDKLSEKALHNIKTIIEYASKSEGIEIKVEKIKEDRLFSFSGRVSEAP